MACAFCRPEDLCSPRRHEHCRQELHRSSGAKKRRHQDDKAEWCTSNSQINLALASGAPKRPIFARVLFPEAVQQRFSCGYAYNSPELISAPTDPLEETRL